MHAQNPEREGLLTMRDKERARFRAVGYPAVRMPIHQQTTDKLRVRDVDLRTRIRQLNRCSRRPATEAVEPYSKCDSAFLRCWEVQAQTKSRSREQSVSTSLAVHSRHQRSQCEFLAA